MTASVSFIKQRKDDILAVPSAALRFTPTALSAADKAKALFLAGVPSDFSEAERDKALAGYETAAKAQAEASKSGKATTQTSCLANLMSVFFFKQKTAYEIHR